MPTRPRLLFGTGGVPHSSEELSTESGIRRIGELGLGCMEVEFVRGIAMTRATARTVGRVADTEGVTLSAHAPYYVNLNARDPKKAAASESRILRTAWLAYVFGARSAVFHCGFYMEDDPETAFESIRARVERMTREVETSCPGLRLRPEVTGKASTFGTLDEVVRLCEQIEGLAPAVDFAHWHARTGEANSYAEFADMLEQIGNRLGDEALRDMHIHVSGIEYGPRGERRHLPLRLSDFNYFDLLRALKDYRVAGLLICESPLLEADALFLSQTYEAL